MGVGAPLASQPCAPWWDGDIAGWWWVFSGMTSRAGMAAVVAVARMRCCVACRRAKLHRKSVKLGCCSAGLGRELQGASGSFYRRPWAIDDDWLYGHFLGPARNSTRSCCEFLFVVDDTVDIMQD
jgi:ribosomal protein L37AE/L43A